MAYGPQSVKLISLLIPTLIVLQITYNLHMQITCIGTFSSESKALDRQHLPCDSLRIAILDVAELPELQNREVCDLHNDVHVRMKCVT